MQETWVQSLGQNNPLEKEITTHPSILAWKIPPTEKPGGLQGHGVERESDTTEQLNNLSQSVYVCWREGDPKGYQQIALTGGQ